MQLKVPTRSKQLISLTPLIDVVFILLLFFMLSSTFNRTHKIELSSTSSASAASQVTENSSFNFVIYQDGEIRIDGEVYQQDSAAFATRLNEITQEQAAVYLAAQEDVAVQSLILLIDRLSKAGIKNLSLRESVTR